MTIVTTMRTLTGIISTLLIALVGVAVSVPAQASPVTDQYTEEIPTPAGPVDKPDKPVKNTSNDGNDSGDDSTYVPPSTDYGTDYDYDTDTSDGSQGSSDDKKEKKSAKKDDDKKTAKVAEPKEEKTSTGAITASGGDGGGGDGMGWVFPVALVIVAGVVGGFAYFRHQRQRVAT